MSIEFCDLTGRLRSTGEKIRIGAIETQILHNENGIPFIQKQVEYSGKFGNQMCDESEIMLIHESPSILQPFLNWLLG